MPQTFCRKLKAHVKDLLVAAVGFAVSLLLTWLFIERFDGYISTSQMMLSNAVADGKWGIQLVLAAALLGVQRWSYFREMGIVCAAGSCVLIPYILFGGGGTFFVGSLVGCVILMGVLVAIRLRAISVSMR